MLTFFSKMLMCWLVCLSFANGDDGKIQREWQVDGVTRTARVYVPATVTEVQLPVVFAFHGHGGNSQQAARTFDYQSRWPEAIVVYMQGLNTPGKLTDPQGLKPGWQHAAGDQQDRDLKFFDTVLNTLKTEYKVDDNRVYATELPTAAPLRIYCGVSVEIRSRPSLHLRACLARKRKSSSPNQHSMSPEKMTPWLNTNGSNKQWNWSAAQMVVLRRANHGPVMEQS